VNNGLLVQRYAHKNNQPDVSQDFKPSFDGKSRGADLLMLLIFTGCKLASQQHLEGAAKIVHICHCISGGYRFQRQHLEFLVQFVKQKSNKILNMEAEIEEMRTQLGG
jgi:hypothetical protein